MYTKSRPISRIEEAIRHSQSMTSPSNKIHKKRAKTNKALPSLRRKVHERRTCLRLNKEIEKELVEKLVDTRNFQLSDIHYTFSITNIN